MKSTAFPSFLLLAAFLCCVTGLLRAEDTSATVKFSDPSKPGTLNVRVAQGSVHVHGSDTAEVSVRASGESQSAARKDGLRVLTSSDTYAFSEAGNVATLEAGSYRGTRRHVSYEISVPRNTTVVVHDSNGSSVSCEGVTGDIDIRNGNGEVKLDDVRGAANVETMNGAIHAKIAEVHSGKPLFFTSMNGEVVLFVPGDAKANVRLSTHNGAILTDFDEKALVTKTASTKGRTVVVRRLSSADDDVFGVDLEAVKQMGQMARDQAQQALDQGEVKALREAAHQAEVSAHTHIHDGDESEAPTAAIPPVPPVPPVAPMAHLPHMAALPSMTGGRIVSGTLNGGGADIHAVTMNGDVTLRKE